VSNQPSSRHVTSLRFDEAGTAGAECLPVKTALSKSDALTIHQNSNWIRSNKGLPATIN